MPDLTKELEVLYKELRLRRINVLLERLGHIPIPPGQLSLVSEGEEERGSLTMVASGELEATDGVL